MIQSKKNRYVAAAAAFCVFGMVGMSYAAVPLYNLFCKVTGYGGTTQKVELASSGVIDRPITVRFVANTNQDMPWDFKPMQVKQKMKVGEQSLAYFEAYNPTNQTLVGRATYNVSPHKAGSYFSKIECFCFTEQILKPGERVEMPVVYYLDPEMDQDINLDEVTEVTLSYTFFLLDAEETADVLAGR
ncbi:cytochrome c oxidase assembly protein [Kordiimonas pumila]|uniref:Cytochrome c oxidase assembly protein CtaG n=1 Tax=Kordiimonas pumila TaxID=2161677 RepID=A0ABV7D8Y8_9PROT|nr:cytochrome c oxidase assembly protein [Kordiimonas pumila]